MHFPPHACGKAVLQRWGATLQCCCNPEQRGHSALATQQFHAADEHPPLLPVLQPREIKRKSSLLPNTDPHFLSPRSLTNTPCAPHLFSAYHLLVS